MDKISIFGLIVTIIFIFLVIYSLENIPFPSFQNPKDYSHFVSIELEPMKEYSQFLWEKRAQDLIAQAFLMFVAAISCITIFRKEVKEK
ncbi:MAG: hypothetical protein LM593_04675 [Candidatus Verstraetearchaeota archaeon]|jgi:ABC-type uncharacterized transport system permease subunit|nr:hypothetical protein [Candidatus Verstraetearchaeota archaeon]